MNTTSFFANTSTILAGGLNKSLLQQRYTETRSALQKHHLFGGLSAKHIDRLASCIIGRSLPRGTTIFSKGDPGSSLFAIHSGEVKITMPSVDGHDAIFNLIGSGAIFGEIALFDGLSRTADAIAMTDCELFIIERRDFLPLVRDEPEIAIRLIEILCGRLRQTTDQVENLMFLPMPGRLAKALLLLAGGGGDANEGKVAVTQNDLGNMIGRSRESINRQLRAWEKRKWVRLERRATVILSMKALERIVETDLEGC